MNCRNCQRKTKRKQNRCNKRNRESVLPIQLENSQAVLGWTATAHRECTKLCALIYVIYVFVCNQQCAITKAERINYTICFPLWVSNQEMDFLLMLVLMLASNPISLFHNLYSYPSEWRPYTKTRYFLEQRLWTATTGHKRPYLPQWTFSKAVRLCPVVKSYWLLKKGFRRRDTCANSTIPYCFTEQ